MLETQERHGHTKLRDGKEQEVSGPSNTQPAESHDGPDGGQ